ncbi:MAG TPA: N-methyl-L-tryptophan oxidase [Planctomycetota bacterium]|nr:N-methyl-L-tryptophan oxidase [Planctomycetota bacterium]
MKRTDVIVIGGGAMGCATAWQLARRGASVRLIEQYAIGHELGSSHGYSRIIRRAYFEHPDYVPLVDRAYELWRELESATGETLLKITGIVEMGSPEGPLLKGSGLSCREHRIPHEILSAAQIRKRFPQFEVPLWMSGIWQKDAGILAVERCLLAMRSEAKKLGAEINEEEEVLSIDPGRGKCGMSVRTRRGTYSANAAVVCAGPWTVRMLSELNLPLIVTRQAMGFYKPLKRELFELGTFPLFLMEVGGHNFYGFPFFGIDAMKVAHHHGGQIVSADTVDRNFNREDDTLLREYLESYIPQAAGPLTLGKVCLYTCTPDMDFILDLHPRHKNIAIAAGFSGHGFKFATTVGEVMADLATRGKTDLPVRRFTLGRFAR